MSRLNQAEALFAFMTGLKHRDKELVIGKGQSSERLPDLIFDFNINFNLDPPRANWEKILDDPNAIIEDLGGGVKGRVQAHSPDWKKVVDKSIVDGTNQVNIGHHILYDDANASSLFDCLAYAVMNKVKVLILYDETQPKVKPVKKKKPGNILRKLR